MVLAAALCTLELSHGDDIHAAIFKILLAYLRYLFS